MNCYLCNSTEHTGVKGQVRDRHDIKILKCKNCGLVFLDKTEHISEGFYENGGMGRSVNFGNIYAAGEYKDTEKRFSLYKNYAADNRVLDFGCGKGKFLFKLKNEKITDKLFALEPDASYSGYLCQNFTLYKSIDEIPDESLDLITLFHVLEHLCDPLDILNKLYKKLAPNGKMVIEVPNAEDALLNLYDCDAFSKFTYWSCHLYLFNSKTLAELIKKTAFETVCIRQYQRYPLSNHMHWLSKGKPAGHIEWSFLDDEVLQAQYEKKLAEISQCDTVVAIVNK
jgi:2-polyprenyl-3-methyl-5-hydroxy-6-metoxy-1,4-benzoquinol methylase